MARQTDRIITNIDHLLHFAQALRQDLAGFQRDQLSQRVFVQTQFLAQQTDEFTTPGSRDFAPLHKSRMGLFDERAGLGGAGFCDMRDQGPINRGMNSKTLRTQPRGGDSKRFKKAQGLFTRRWQHGDDSEIAWEMFFMIVPLVKPMCCCRQEGPIIIGHFFCFGARRGAAS